ncbi:MAG TPA: GspH/FimT family protein [Candidatus Limnocylindrales bacterium]|nr:GspH/FimT family protein [Candidatus Limnocylindrales bacterium]
MRRRGGFTLIELVVVLLIVGVAAAVIVPSIGRGSEALRARAQVSGFAAFLRHAREQAVTRREVHEVRIDPQARVVVLTGAGSDTPRLSRRLGEGWRIQASPPAAFTVTFHPQGLSSGGSFRIEAAGGRVFVVTVDPLTGRVAQRRGDT